MNRKEQLPQSESYFNTTWETYPELAEYELKASNQDIAASAYLQENFAEYFTAEQVHGAIMENVPLTSTRRALTNLFNAGLIEKGAKVKGMYGRPIYTWRWKTKQIDLFTGKPE